jgi:hypothetical protein
LGEAYHDAANRYAQRRRGRVWFGREPHDSKQPRFECYRPAQAHIQPACAQRFEHRGGLKAIAVCIDSANRSRERRGHPQATPITMLFVLRRLAYSVRFRGWKLQGLI